MNLFSLLSYMVNRNSFNNLGTIVIMNKVIKKVTQIVKIGDIFKRKFVE